MRHPGLSSLSWGSQWLLWSRRWFRGWLGFELLNALFKGIDSLEEVIGCWRRSRGVSLCALGEGLIDHLLHSLHIDGWLDATALLRSFDWIVLVEPEANG
jgi:hypothetical protein